VSKLNLQFDLANLAPADANPVQSNFSRTELHVNQELLERDGTVAMRQPLRLAGDPVNLLDATPKQYVDTVLPVGVIMSYGGTTVPAGGRWLLCDGTEYQTADYPELFAVIGTNYVVGTPSTGRFNVPNLTNRFPMGGSPGTTGGVADAVVVNHTHPIDHGHAGSTSGADDRDHVHGDDHQHSGGTAGMNANATHHHESAGVEGQQGSSFGARALYSQGVGPGDISFWTGETNTDHAHGFTTNFKSQQGYGTNTGGHNTGHLHATSTPAMGGPSGAAAGGVAGTNQNLPPYIGVAFIIRAH